MIELPANKSPEHPDWLEPHIKGSAPAIDPFSLPCNISHEVKSKVVDSFNRGIRLPWFYKDIAWEVYKEYNIDPITQWLN